MSPVLVLAESFSKHFLNGSLLRSARCYSGLFYIWLHETTSDLLVLRVCVRLSMPRSLHGVKSDFGLSTFLTTCTFGQDSHESIQIDPSVLPFAAKTRTSCRSNRTSAKSTRFS